MTSFLSGLDRHSLRLLRTRLHSPLIVHMARRYALLGEYGALWAGLALAGAGFDRDRRSRWLAVAGLVPSVLWANYLVKLAVRRRRPHLGLPAPGCRPATHSFPSGHAATAFAAAEALGKLNPQMRPLLIGAAALMALTRPYLGLHYPSDVLAGALLGGALGRALAACWGNPQAATARPRR